MKKKVIFISSAGGHLEQLLNLRQTMEKFNSHIITEKNPSTEKLKGRFSNLYFLPYFSRKNKLTYPFVFIGIIFKSLNLFFKIKPDIIVSTGAGCVIPMFVIGRIFGKKLIFIETFSRTESQTLTGRICYPISNEFVIQWEQLKDFYPNAKYLGSIY